MWTRQNSGVNTTPHAVDAANEMSDWAVGEDGAILHTNNGGASWNSQPNVSSNDLFDVTFVDANTGRASGENEELRHTFDAGANWSFQSSLQDSPTREIDFVNKTHGWFAGTGSGVGNTTNSGAIWSY